MKIQISYNNKVISNDILVADNAITRMIGLMFKKKLIGADGLWIDPAPSIHTFFMRYSLDIVFVNSKKQVIKIIREMKPWRMTRYYFTARQVLEMPAGKLPVDLKVGDVLEVKNV